MLPLNVFLVPNVYSSQDESDLTTTLRVEDDTTGDTHFSLTSSKYFDWEEVVDISNIHNFSSCFSIISVNARSLKSKVSHIANLLSHLSSLPTIICIQEVWSGHGSLNIPGYQPITAITRDRDVPNPNCGGGVGLYVREGISFSVIKVPNSVITGVIESQWVNVYLPDKTCRTIGNIYRPNTAPLADVARATRALDSMIQYVSNLS